MSPTGCSKVMVQHLQRLAVAYLRQSSEFQVRHNRESQKLQYAMANQARRCGFREVEVIDCDLGRSTAMGGGAGACRAAACGAGPATRAAARDDRRATQAAC